MSQTEIGDGLATVESPNMLFEPPKSRAFVCRGDCGKVKRLRSGYAAAQPDVMIDAPVLVQSAAF
jgi:hypothetical protein